MNDTAIKRILVIGVGLIGGSLAKALKELGAPPTILGIDTDPETLDWALAHGVLDEGALPDSQQAADWLVPGGCDLIVVATPATFAVRWLSAMVRHYTGTSPTLHQPNDVTAAARSSRRARATWWTPVAGSERTGNPQHVDLFSGGYWLSPGTTRTHAYRTVHALVSSIGARVISVDAEAHEAVAIVSHLLTWPPPPRDLAAVHAGERRARLAAGGFKDTTRIAAGSAGLWTGIWLIMRTPWQTDCLSCERSWRVRSPCQVARRRRHHRVAASAAEVRRALPHGGARTAALTELIVPMGDRPGVVAEITGAVSRALQHRGHRRRPRD
jgi:prephenate dehydrogenase